MRQAMTKKTRKEKVWIYNHYADELIKLESKPWPWSAMDTAKIKKLRRTINKLQTELEL
jgi:hypothetical protein